MLSHLHLVESTFVELLYKFRDITIATLYPFFRAQLSFVCNFIRTSPSLMYYLYRCFYPIQTHKHKLSLSWFSITLWIEIRNNPLLSILA